MIMIVLASPKQNEAKALRCPSAPQIHKQAVFSSTTITIPDAHSTAASPSQISRKMMQANKASPGLMRALKIDEFADWQ